MFLHWAKDMTSHLVGFSWRKLLEVKLSTSEICAWREDTELASVQMSSACRYAPL